MVPAAPSLSPIDRVRSAALHSPVAEVFRSTGAGGAGASAGGCAAGVTGMVAVCGPPVFGCSILGTDGGADGGDWLPHAARRTRLPTARIRINGTFMAYRLQCHYLDAHCEDVPKHGQVASDLN